MFAQIINIQLGTIKYNKRTKDTKIDNNDLRPQIRFTGKHWMNDVGHMCGTCNFHCSANEKLTIIVPLSANHNEFFSQ